MKPDKEPFTRVSFLAEYPVQDVAEHEVFLSFRDDADALVFHDWWNSDGAFAFNAYVKTKRELNDA